jgi:hypothetical protein
MSRAFESGTRRRVSRSRDSDDEPPALVALGKRFARFRRKHPRGTRIPDDLREAALVLLREVAPGGGFDNPAWPHFDPFIWPHPGRW